MEQTTVPPMPLDTLPPPAREERLQRKLLLLKKILHRRWVNEEKRLNTRIIPTGGD